MKNLKFSLITPEHNPSNLGFLQELYDTICSQIYSNWEWVLYLNGDATNIELPLTITSNPKVIVVKGETHNNIGYIKHKSFMLGTGDVLVEVDHDDLLSSDCLLELNKAFQDDEVGFVYSDDLLYDMIEDSKRDPFRADLGWIHSWENFREDTFLRMHSFPSSSRSLSFIWYAPDHVRAWRSSVYREIGGHNPDMYVCDDHELMIRTYLKTKFAFVDKVLYYYRLLPAKNNTYLVRNEAIQKTTVELFNKYARSLAERDSDLLNLMKVDIGGGLFPLPNYTTIDQFDADIICDLNTGIPLPDNSVGVLNASHILEHLKDPFFSMKEIYRVLADGGWAFIQVPSTDGRGAWQDPTHVSFWNENSFKYYTRKEKAQYIRNTSVRFQEFKLDTIWWPENVAVVNAWLCPIKTTARRPHSILI